MSGSSRRFRRQRDKRVGHEMRADDLDRKARAVARGDLEGAQVMADLLGRITRSAEHEPGTGDELTPEQRQQVERTSRGQCAGCGIDVEQHRPPRMRCPNGSGQELSFAYGRATRERTIARLEELQRCFERGASDRAKLSEDARALLDAMQAEVGLTADDVASLAVANVVDGELPPGPFGPTVSGPSLAKRLGWAQERVRLASVELAELGLLDFKPGMVS